jgi:hypothetical protein
MNKTNNFCSWLIFEMKFIKKRCFQSKNFLFFNLHLLLKRKYIGKTKYRIKWIHLTPSNLNDNTLFENRNCDFSHKVWFRVEEILLRSGYELLSYWGFRASVRLGNCLLWGGTEHLFGSFPQHSFDVPESNKHCQLQFWNSACTQP